MNESALRARMRARLPALVADDMKERGPHGRGAGEGGLVRDGRARVSRPGLPTGGNEQRRRMIWHAPGSHARDSLRGSEQRSVLVQRGGAAIFISHKRENTECSCGTIFEGGESAELCRTACPMRLATWSLVEIVRRGKVVNWPRTPPSAPATASTTASFIVT